MAAPLVTHISVSFVGIDLGRELVPDESTLCKFRHLLEQYQLGGEMLETVQCDRWSGLRWPDCGRAGDER